MNFLSGKKKAWVLEPLCSISSPATNSSRIVNSKNIAAGCRTFSRRSIQVCPRVRHIFLAMAHSIQNVMVLNDQSLRLYLNVLPPLNCWHNCCTTKVHKTKTKSNSMQTFMHGWEKEMDTWAGLVQEQLCEQLLQIIIASYCRWDWAVTFSK